VQCDANTPNKRFCVGKVMLGARPSQGYDTSITNPEIIAGEKFAGYFRKLDYGTDYLIPNRGLGFISFNINVPDNYNVGVVYSNNANQNFGKGTYSSLTTDTLILKLFKVANESPVTTPLAWQLKMKNVYDLHYKTILSTSKVYLKYFNNSINYDTIPGYSSRLITMLTLDRVNNSTLLPPPDGICDWSYVLTSSFSFPTYIIFPVLEPFGQGLQEAGVSSEYQFNEIYTQSKLQAQGNAKANMYKLMGTVYYIDNK
jgi:cell surface protein SprA